MWVLLSVVPTPMTNTVASPEPMTDIIMSPKPNKQTKSRNRCALKRSAAARWHCTEVTARVMEFNNTINNVHTSMEHSHKPEGSACRQHAWEWLNNDSGDDAVGVEGTLLV